MIWRGVARFRPHIPRCPARFYTSSHIVAGHSEAQRVGLENSARAKSDSKWLRPYQLAVESGKFNGSYDAWILGRGGGNRVPGACSYISTLQLSKVIKTKEYVNLRSREFRPFMSREVLVNGRDVGRAELYFPPSSHPSDLFMTYYDPEKGLLRFLSEDGEPLSEAMDVDLIAKADQHGVRPLLLLAQAEGLIDKVPSGRLTSLDFQTIIDSGFYVRANVQKSGMYQPSISLPEASRSFRFRITLSGPPKPYIRFFPYIHQDGTVRFWDVERSDDLNLRWGNHDKSWGPLEVKKRIPELFYFAQSIGYWKGVR